MTDFYFQKASSETKLLLEVLTASNATKMKLFLSQLPCHKCQSVISQTSYHIKGLDDSLRFITNNQVNLSF